MLLGCSQTDNARTAQPEKTAPLPQRIISLTPSNTEILYALGLEGRVAGITKYCDYPPETAKKTKVGESSVSLEKVVALKPDLVLAHSVLNDIEIRRLKALGIKVLDTDPETFAEVIADIRKIGKATGTNEQAEKLAGSMEKAIDTAKNKSHRGQKAKMLVVIQASPLWVAGPKTFVDEMISYSNGENIARDAKPGFNQFSSEIAFARNPDLIIVTRPEDKTYFKKSPVWKETNAVRSGHVEVIDPDLMLRPGPRLVQGLKALSTISHSAGR